MNIVLDFDGTVVDHRFPAIGPAVPYCLPSLRFLLRHDFNIILSTMRFDSSLKDAVDWFGSNDIKLYGIQKHPTQHGWTNSPKCDGDCCIDDRNVGTPLMVVPRFHRPCVQWHDMEKNLRNIEGVVSLTLKRFDMYDDLFHEYEQEMRSVVP